MTGPFSRPFEDPWSPRIQHLPLNLTQGSSILWSWGRHVTKKEAKETLGLREVQDSDKRETRQHSLYIRLFVTRPSRLALAPLCLSVTLTQGLPGRPRDFGNVSFYPNPLAFVTMWVCRPDYWVYRWLTIGRHHRCRIYTTCYLLSTGPSPSPPLG